MVTLEELRKRFSIGTKVYPAHYSIKKNYFVVSTKEFMISELFVWANTMIGEQNNGNDLENGTLGDNDYRVVWYRGKGWAKIHNENKIYEVW